MFSGPLSGVDADLLVVPWFEDEPSPETGGLVSTGPRRRPRPNAWFVAWPGQWGTAGWFGRDTGGPFGPAYQAAWCSGGVDDRC